MPSFLNLQNSNFLGHIKAVLDMPYTPFAWRDKQSYKRVFVWLCISFIFASVCVSPFYIQWICELCDVEAPKILVSILGVLSIASVLFTPKNRRFSVGFFIGVLWFYWIGLGLRYFDMSVLIPLVIVAEALLIACVFYISLWCECLLWRFGFIMLLSYFTPLGFDWIMLESVFAFSYFGVDKLSLGLIVLGLWVTIKYERWWKIVGIVCLIFALDSKTFSENPPQISLKIKLMQSEVSQDITWRMEQMGSIFQTYIDQIERAKNEGYEAIILPESAFYVPLDSKYFSHFDKLIQMSKDIVIVVGALRVEQNENGEVLYFNSTYKFENGEMTFLDKVLLVPFGERLPQSLLPIVNVFFEGIGGFSPGREFGYFDIKGVRFKNAICYEGTNSDFYADNPQLVIVTSNNAWFVPSIEPILQKNLMKYYARLHNSTILHATNLSKAAIITP
nr:apolipoprotein N-acyltransferase [uncultured Helicobacter sp.]